MGIFRKTKAVPEQVPDVPREAWTGYEDLSEECPAYTGGMSWMVPRVVLWTAFLSCAALAAYLLFSISFTFRFYPRTYINDVDVSGMTVLEASDALAGSVSRDVTIRLRSGEYVIGRDELGVRMSCEPSVGSLASGQSGYPWVRHDYRCETSVSYDKTEVLAAVNRVLDEHPEDAGRTEAGIAFETDGSMSYHAGSGAYKRDDAAARDLAASLIMAGAWEVDLTAMDCYDAPFALLPDQDLEETCRQWNARLESGLLFLCGEDGYYLPRDGLAEHTSRDGSDLLVDGAWLRETVSGWLGLESPSGGFDVRGVIVSDDAAKALHAARLREETEKVVASFEAGASGVELDVSSLDGWISGGTVLVLDPGANWAVAYRGDEAMASCGVTFHNGTDGLRDAVAAFRDDGKLRLSNDMTVGGPGCNLELAEPDKMSAAFGGGVPRCVVFLAQDGSASERHMIPEAQGAYRVRLAG